MKVWVSAKIEWLSVENGGRKTPMAVNIRYCPIIRFLGSEQCNGSWSADIFVQSNENHNTSNAKLSFLSEDAPFELLQEGAAFELFEGIREVATGTII